MKALSQTILALALIVSALPGENVDAQTVSHPRLLTSVDEVVDRIQDIGSPEISETMTYANDGIMDANTRHYARSAKKSKTYMTKYQGWSSHQWESWNKKQLLQYCKGTEYRFVRTGTWHLVLDHNVPKGTSESGIKLTLNTGTEEVDIKHIAAEIGVEVGAEGGMAGVTAKVSAKISAGMQHEFRVSQSREMEFTAPVFDAKVDSRVIIWQLQSEVAFQRKRKGKDWQTLDVLTSRSDTFYTDIFPKPGE